MKKYLEIAALLLTGVLLTNVSCKKENPLDSINYDDPSFTQLVSLIGQDSTTVAETLIKKGFTKQYLGFQKTDYGFRYNFECKNGKITIIHGSIRYKTSDEARTKFREKSSDIIDQNFTYFRAYTEEDDTYKRLACTKNPYEAKLIAQNEQFDRMLSWYAKKDLACYAELLLRWNGDEVNSISYEISGPDGEGSSGIDNISSGAYASCDDKW